MQEDLDRVFHYFPGLTLAQKKQIALLAEVYQDWNEKINVVSRKDINQIYIHHVLHSLSVAKTISFNNDARLLDIGTGGGFPGIPLAILFPDTQFHLVDSIRKKIDVVKEVAAYVALDNVLAEQKRAEKVKGTYDFVLSRAVAPISKLYNWTRDNIAPKSRHSLANGLICLKGGDLAAELGNVPLNYHLYAIHNYFSEDFFKSKYVIHATRN